MSFSEKLAYRSGALGKFSQIWLKMRTKALFVGKKACIYELKPANKNSAKYSGYVDYQNLVASPPS